MDNLRQLGKKIRKDRSTSDTNLRRVGENFPKIERTTDKLNPQQSFKHEFSLSDHKHSVRATFFFQPPDADCEVQPIDEFIALHADCQFFSADLSGASGTGTADGVPRAGFGDREISNIGGFVRDPAGGWIVPVTGIYEVHFVNGIASVAVGSGAEIVASLRVGGAIINQAMFGSPCPTGLCLFSPVVDLYATLPIAAGTNVAGWLSASSSVAFFTPSNLCGFTGGSYLEILLVGQE